MFPNLPEQTNQARVDRAIDRMKACTTIDDLNRVYENCQPLIDHLIKKGTDDLRDEGWVLAKKLHNAKIDMQIEIELPRVAQSAK
jgi:hypothetical protein